MRKILFLLAMIIIAVPLQLQGQTYTEAFDSAFVNINRADATTGILYERMFPFAKLQNFNSNLSSVDTSNSQHFIQAYFELYGAAFDTSVRLPFNTDSLKSLIEDNGNIVDVGILHYKFNTLDSNVAYQKLIIVDSVIIGENTAITASLYTETTAFVVSPLSASATGFGGLTFRFNNEFYFENTGDSLIQLLVDFDDGLGLRPVSMNSTVFVSYIYNGQKTLQFVAIIGGETYTAYATIDYTDHSFTQYSPSSLTPHSGWTDIYDETIWSQISLPNPYTGGTFPLDTGLVRIYYANPDMQLRKPILLVDGFDPDNKRKFEEHNEGDDSIWQLLYYKNRNGSWKNFGRYLLELYKYDLVFLDFPDGAGYIEKNAMICIEVINELNSRLVPDENGHKHKLVIVGPSMGGQITRYALTYMEQNPGPLTNYGDHNCRLWISFDSPHQGANISIGAQAFMKYFSSISSGAADGYEQICSPAAKQMLLHHREVNGSAAHSYHHIYYNGLRNLNPATDGYPQNLRKIAIANGSLNNTSNGNPGNTVFHGSLIYPLYWVNDLIDIRIRFAPDHGSTSDVLVVRHWMIIKIPLTPIIIPYVTTTRHSFNNNTTRCSPDAAPGGYFNTFSEVEKGLKNNWYTSWPFVLGSNEHTHCFIPTTSALDVSNVTGAGITNYCVFLPVDLVKAGRIPFDAYWAPEGKNMEHVTFDYELAEWLFNEINTSFVYCCEGEIIYHIQEEPLTDEKKQELLDDCRCHKCDRRTIRIYCFDGDIKYKTDRVWYENINVTCDEEYLYIVGGSIIGNGVSIKEFIG